MANNWDYIPLELKDNEPDSAPHTSVLNINDPMEIADESSKRVMLNSGAIPFTNLSKPGASPVHNNNSQGASNTSEMLRINSVEEAPLARIEFEDDEREDDDREFVSRPYPGVDDGFFADNDVNDSRETFPGDVELIPKSKHPEELAPHTPELTPRVAPDGENRPPDVPPSPKELPRFPLPRDTPDFHGFKPSFSDEETGTQGTETIPDVNVYQHKKTLAQGMMDLALFSANANQLRYVLENFGKSHPYSVPSLVLISLSLILQVVIGAGLVWNATLNIKDEKALCVANKVNNMTTIGVFFVTVINVFISAFGITTNPAT